MGLLTMLYEALEMGRVIRSTEQIDASPADRRSGRIVTMGAGSY